MNLPEIIYNDEEDVLHISLKPQEPFIAKWFTDNIGVGFSIDRQEIVHICIMNLLKEIKKGNYKMPQPPEVE